MRTRGVRGPRVSPDECTRGASLTSPGDPPGSATPATDRFVALFTAAPFGIALTDADGVIVEANPALGAFLGVDPAELRGTPFVDRSTGQGDAARVRAPLSDHNTRSASGRHVGAVTEHAPDAPVHADVSVIPLPCDDPSRGYPAIMVRDVSDLHLLQERLHHQNVHDPLTGLPNAASFHGKLEEIGRAHV